MSLLDNFCEKNTHKKVRGYVRRILWKNLLKLKKKNVAFF